MRVCEIFSSLQGEADGFGEQGQVTTFVRLQGCNLNCQWCDTPQAQNADEGKELSVNEIFAEIKTRKVTITGGEPLLQGAEVVELVERLDEVAHTITIETNGSMLLPPQLCEGSLVCFVVDYKLDSSGATGAMKEDVFSCLSMNDVIKFAIKDLPDYRQAVELCRSRDWEAKKVFSPLMGEVLFTCQGHPGMIAKQMITDNLNNISLSLQLHKLLDLQ